MRNELLNNTIEKIKQLDEKHLESVNNFIELLNEESYHNESAAAFAKLAAQSRAFDFLNDEPDIYTDADLIKSNE